MTQEQYEELYNWVYEEIHHNRDSYSRSKIIEMIMDKTEKLVNKTNDIHDVSNPLHEFDRFVHKNYPNDYYVVSTLMDFFGERNDC